MANVRAALETWVPPLPEIILSLDWIRFFSLTFLNAVAKDNNNNRGGGGLPGRGGRPNLPLAIAATNNSAGVEEVVIWLLENPEAAPSTITTTTIK